MFKLKCRADYIVSTDAKHCETRRKKRNKSLSIRFRI